MPSPSRAGAVSLITVWLLASAGTPALAAETTSSEIVIIRPGNEIQDDLYAGALRVSIEGEIHGDLVVFAAEELVIEGTVTGSVTAVAPTVRVDGTIDGSLRVAGADVRVGGEVSGDLVVAGFEVDLGAGSRIGGDVLAWVADLDADGEIGGDIGGTQRALRLAGSVGGEVDVSVGTLVVSGPLSVGGDLAFRSDREAEGLSRAEVGGSVVHRVPLPANIRVRSFGLFSRLMVILFLGVSALTAAYLWPERTRAAISEVSGSPWRSWLLGAAILFSPLLVAGAAAAIVVLAPASAALPLLLILVPVILALLGLALAVSVAAGVPAVGRLGAVLWRGGDLYGWILVGTVVAGVVWLIPLIGWLVPVVVLPLGLGGWLRSQTRSPSVSDAPA